MADSNLKRGEPQLFADNDPFAELTRIMARDTRPASDEAVADDAFGIDLEKELLGSMDDPFQDREEAEAAYVAPVAAARAAVAPEDYDTAFAAEFEEASWQEVAPAAAPAVHQAPPMQADLRGYETAYAAPEGAAEPVAHRATGPEAALDAGLADVDMDFGDLDFSDGDDAAFDEEAAEPDFEPQPAVAQGQGGHEPSLEDELGMLLASGGAERNSHSDIASAGADDWRPSADPHIPLYGRANYAPGTQQGGVGNAPMDEAQGDEMMARETFVDEPAWDQPVARDSWEEPVAAASWDEPAAMAEDAGHAEFEPVAELAVEPVVTPAEPQPAADPFAIFSSIAPAAPRPQHHLLAPAPARAQTAQAFDTDELETVEVIEAAVPLQDDLDLPEAEITDEPPLAYDDYETEFTQAFGEMGDGAAAAAAAEAESRAAQEADERFFAEALGFGAAAAGTAAAGDYRQPSWERPDYRDAQTDRGSDIEREIDVAAYGTAAAMPAARRRNGMFVAAAVAAVAVLGGIGVFAFGFGGGDSADAPVLVQADNEPLKVKPENPGGTAVPNQDSEAYNRVAGSGAGAAASQERLVTTTEEPVDLAARTEEASLPGVDEDIAALAESGDELVAKSEERIQTPASQDAPGVGAADDLAAVQPRKVRTMVVRPDGTLVPREEPAPAAAAPETMAAAAQPGPSAAAIAAPAAGAIREVSAEASATRMQSAEGTQPATTTLPAIGQPAGEQVAAAGQSGTAAAAAPAETAATPATGPVVPQKPAAQPADSQPAPQAQRNAPQQVAQAAAPARAQPEAAAGEWSMQIASQPTAEGAQATYQDLARRYGGVLGGHGVSIVRADIPGKGTYYRVRIPSTTRSDAISLCEKYKAAGGSCFVSK